MTCLQSYTKYKNINIARKTKKEKREEKKRHYLKQGKKHTINKAKPK